MSVNLTGNRAPHHAVSVAETFSRASVSRSHPAAGADGRAGGRDIPESLR
ncbi:hypothetical protein [Azospirillum argentinense]